MLSAISNLVQLEGLVLTSNGVCTDPDRPRYSYPYFIDLCSTVSKLRRLKYLHVSHWSCLTSQIIDKLPEELIACTPPEGLKTIIIEVIDEPLPIHYVSWLLHPRGNFAPANFMLRAAEVVRDQFLSSFFLRESNLSSISYLNVDSKLFLVKNVNSLVLACTNLKVLHLNFTIPSADFFLPSSVEELRFRLFEIKHDDCRRKDKVLSALLDSIAVRKSHPSDTRSHLRSIVLEPEFDFDRFWDASALCKYFPMSASSCHAANIQFRAGQTWHGSEATAIADFLSLDIAQTS